MKFNKVSYIPCIILLLLLFSVGCHSFDFNGRCEIIDPLSPCNGTIPNNTLIYLNSSQTQAQFHADAQTALNGIKLTSDPECIYNATIVTCSIIYQPCTMYNDSGMSVAFPSKPCQSSCKTTEDACAAFLFLIPITCADETDGVPDFPNSTTTYPISPSSSQTIDVACNKDYTETSDVTFCLKPLLYVDDDMLNDELYYTVIGRCALPCPFDIYSHSAELAIYYIQTILSSVSFVGSMFLVLFYGILPNKIITKFEIILSFAICTISVEISYFFVNKSKSNFCDGDRYTVNSDAICAANGVLFQFGGLSMIFWWTMICYDYFLSLRMEKMTHFKYYRVGIWTVSFLFTIIPLIGKQYGTTPATSGCWINGDHADIWQYVFFFVPSWICLLLITFFTVYSIKKIYEMYKVLQDKKVILYNIKQIFVMVWVLFNFSFVTAFKFYANDKKQSYMNSVKDWVQCIARDGDENCSLNIEDFQFRMLQVITTCDNGLIGFFAFGLEPSNIITFRTSTLVKKFLSLFNVSFRAEDTLSDPSSAGSAQRKSTQMKKIGGSSLTVNAISSTESTSSSPSVYSGVSSINQSSIETSSETSNPNNP